MFLKRLDILGFKSFAERVSVDFVQGVTAVVGPNGSGKSNITDAVRWVLGEQSAKSLRGAKMEDIIFAGSDSRKGLNIAEVTLTLDNSDQFLPIDYHEVGVTRRVYRSGDSEFYINGQSCRLKDIIDLFLDSGLGKEAFSIISQGKVEEILSSKAEERRSIFEEAAGVLKYKNRKKKAESKLTETQDNLNRVEDILHELQGQVEPLKIQASMAKDYLEKKEELEQIEVALTVHEIEELHKKWEELSDSVEKGKLRDEEFSEGVKRKEEEIQETKSRLQYMDESIHDLQQALLLASEELEKLEGRKEVLKERKKNAQQNREQLEKLIIELGEKTALQKKEKIELEAQLADLTSAVKELRKQLKEKEAAFKSHDFNIEEEIERLKSEYFELLNSQTSARNEISYIEDQMRQQTRRTNRMADSNTKYLSERKQLEEQKTKLDARHSVIDQQLSEYIASFRDIQAKLENSQNTYRKRETALYQAYQFLQQAKARKEMLEAMQGDYAGFYQGVKEILKVRDRMEGIHGAIAELLTAEKKYETAIEISLGASAQHIVTENEGAARSAIAFLKKNSYGRATFLPLSVIKNRKLSDSDRKLIETHPAFIGIASELVKYSPEYSHIIGNLLGTVIVTSDLKGANELAKLISYRYRLVTLEGDIVNAGGSMTGGAVKQKNNSLIGRNRELDTAAQQLAEMEQKTAELEGNVKKLKEQIVQQEKQLEELRQKGEKLRNEENAVKTERKELEWNEKTINNHLALYDTEKSAYEEEASQMTERIQGLKKKTEDIHSKLSVLDEEIKTRTAWKTSQQSSKEELQQAITDLKVILAGKQQALENQTEKMERMTNELAENAARLSETKEDLSFLASEATSNSSGEEQLEEAAVQKQQDKQRKIELIANGRKDRQECQAKLEEMELELKELNRIWKVRQDALRSEEVRLNRLDVELDNRLNHLREEYLLSFEGAKEKYTLSIPAKDAEKKVKLIKRAIEELGTVNLGAIDEYERVSERYGFLSGQQTDLLEAKQTLHLVIDEMDEEMKRRFITTFNQIRSHFETVFQALFGGGRAELRLTDPADLLNTGVDIVAQPPGKKLQNLGLLSGGERALTAIALLFSILKVRPVPFCILDEVEAALDEANVHRFAQYLKQFSRETQFIVITHRKGTMEEADVLYGVTMQESGVSKLVSVRMEETKEMINA
ncbi:chromosome segregation protein SMC [Metabacillus sp. GX 13764]|uniref:chromosome segregation protein SMC n=1 Tax=Metabacillus kandeliae TaxID=2900151 RepID=UPI001E65916D|nr:chromosome segregation protein SMC [Metabacillus kandeliae]MCD7033810.1 chromosome segregation protein SMC [Metabacillus kandeliae]